MDEVGGTDGQRGWQLLRASRPRPTTPLIGRRSEIAELLALLERERLVTLTGAGGCGKTRLAVELAVSLDTAGPGASTWADLAAARDGDDVLGRICGAVGGSGRSGDASWPWLHTALDHRGPTLLVLDTAEHLLDPTAAAVAELLPRHPHLTVVVTTREPIGVPGEVVWRVPPLATPPADLDDVEALLGYPAVDLFVDRARRARRDFRLGPANAAQVAQICARLDGLPLAIELAAARLRTMPPARVADQLDDRFRLLTGGPRTAVARQQTLLASIAWSESLLDDEDRTVLRRLAVFNGSFPLDAAEAVVASFGDLDPYAVASAIDRLVDKSLVQFDAESDRHGMLDSVRAFALDLLASDGELAAARDANAEHWADWLDTTGEPPLGSVTAWWERRIERLAPVDADWHNLQAALEWTGVGSARSLRLAAGLGDYWSLRQRSRDSERFGVAAVLAGDRDDPAWLDAVTRLSPARYNAGDPAFPALVIEAVALAAERGHRAAALHLGACAPISRVLVEGPRADLIGELSTLRDQANDIGEWSTVWRTSQCAAIVLAVAGRLEEAEALLPGMPAPRAELMAVAGDLFRGRLQMTPLANRPAGSGVLSTETTMERVLLCHLVAHHGLLTGDPSGLADGRLDAIGADSLPGTLGAATVLLDAVGALLAGDPDGARACLLPGWPGPFAVRLGAVLATELALSSGVPEEGWAEATRLLELGAGLDAPAIEARCHLVLAECDAAERPAAALATAHRALTLAAGCGIQPVVVDCLEVVAGLAMRSGRSRDAALILRAALAARAGGGYGNRLPHRQLAVTGLLADLGHPDPSAPPDRDVVPGGGVGDGVGGAEEGAAPPPTLAAAIEHAGLLARARSRPLSGWDSLTTTEQLVVDLVAAGLSNPEIGERLCVARSTVKTHLVHVYAKLHVRSRAELAAETARRASLYV